MKAEGGGGGGSGGESFSIGIPEKGFLRKEPGVKWLRQGDTSVGTQVPARDQGIFGAV